MAQDGGNSTEPLSTSARLVAADADADTAARLTTFLITLWALAPEDPTQGVRSAGDFWASYLDSIIR